MLLLCAAIAWADAGIQTDTQQRLKADRGSQWFLTTVGAH